MRHLCLTRCFLVYTALCGLAIIAVAFYDASYSASSAASPSNMVILPPLQPLLDLSKLVLPERLSGFCSVELFNESEPQVVVLPRQAEHHKPQEPQQQQTWPATSFDPNRSTEENYTVQQHAASAWTEGLVGRFAAIRRQLDYSYHGVYTQARQHLQDSILSGLLEKAKQGHKKLCSNGHGKTEHVPTERWAVFTAGVMGAGKTHTVELLSRHNRFPLSAFVWVDPDQIRQCLPEFEPLVRYDASQAGDRTRKEAGMMSEILTLAALEAGQSVLVDGSLRDVEWYQEYFAQLRHNYPGIKIAILHVTAPRQAVLERAASRARTTGRVVPISLLEKTMEQVPQSVAILKTKADFFVELHNAPNGGDEVQILQPAGLDWPTFTREWAALCDSTAAVAS